MAVPQNNAGPDAWTGGQHEDRIERSNEQTQSLLSASLEENGQHQFSAHKGPDMDARSARSSTPAGEKEDNATDMYPSRRLRRFRMVVYLACAYAAVAIFAWAIMCVQVYRPITTRDYGRTTALHTLQSPLTVFCRASASPRGCISVQKRLRCERAVATGGSRVASSGGRGDYTADLGHLLGCCCSFCPTAL